MPAITFWIAVVSTAVYVLTGVVCLVWPEKIQSFGLSHPRLYLHKYNPFLWFMRSRYYIWTLRLIGAAALGAGIELGVTMMRLAR